MDDLDIVPNWLCYMTGWGEGRVWSTTSTIRVAERGVRGGGGGGGPRTCLQNIARQYNRVHCPLFLANKAIFFKNTISRRPVRCSAAPAAHCNYTVARNKPIFGHGNGIYITELFKPNTGTHYLRIQEIFHPSH